MNKYQDANNTFILTSFDQTPEKYFRSLFIVNSTKLL